MLAAYIVLIAVLSSGGHADESPQVICGRQLSESIYQLCTSVEKSETVQTMKEAMIDIDDDSMWPWLSRRFMNALTAGARSKRASLVEECCQKPCLMHQLLSYC